MPLILAFGGLLVPVFDPPHHHALCSICAARCPLSTCHVLHIHGTLRRRCHRHFIVDMSGVPHLGFDVVVDKILDIHRDAGHAHDSAQGAVRSVSRQLNSSVVVGGGERAIPADLSDETPAPKRRRPVVVTPSVSSLRLLLSTPLPPDSINTRDWGGVFGPSNSVAMLINQRDSIVPHHSAHRSSILQRKPKVGVGSPRDISKTTVDYDEHENELRNRVLAGVIHDDDVLIEDGNDDGVRDDGNDDGIRDDALAVSNDAESVCANSTSSDAVRLEDSDGEDDEQDVFLSQEERDRRLELSI